MQAKRLTETCNHTLLITFVQIKRTIWSETHFDCCIFSYITSKHEYPLYTSMDWLFFRKADTKELLCNIHFDYLHSVRNKSNGLKKRRKKYKTISISSYFGKYFWNFTYIPNRGYICLISCHKCEFHVLPFFLLTSLCKQTIT